MKNLLLKLTVLVLALTMAMGLVACGDKTEEETQVTGTFKYRLASELREVVDENGEVKLDEDGEAIMETHKYYVITGYEVSSEDALKMAEGDFSTVEQYRVLSKEKNDGDKCTLFPRTGKDLGEDNDYPVEEIEGGAFTNQIILKEVYVGDNIKKIGEGAFAGCTNLEKLSLPFLGESEDSVNSARVFGHLFGASASGDGNVAVTSKIHERKDDTGASILNEAEVSFSVPASIKTVDLSRTTMTSVSECAFYGMSMIKSVILPSTVVSVDSHAFFGCTSLVSFDLGNIETLEQYAFSGCTSLNSVDFKNVKVIKENAFESCVNLFKKKLNFENNGGILTLPASVEFLGARAFLGCEGIVKIDLSATKITTIYQGAFEGLIELKELKVKDGTLIKTGAFAACEELKADKITGSYTSEPKAFAFDD